MTIMDDRTIRVTRRRALAVLAGLVPLALAGCGRKSIPKAPEGSTYNQQYPTRGSMNLPPDPLAPPSPPPDEDDESPSGEPRAPSLRY